MQGRCREMREAILSLDCGDKKTIGKALDIFREILDFLNTNMVYEPPLELRAYCEDGMERHQLQYKELEQLIEMTEFLYDYDEFVVAEEIEE